MIREDVNEIATWTGQGIAHYSGSKRRDEGSVLCRAASTAGLLAFLNNMIYSLETGCYQFLELIPFLYLLLEMAESGMFQIE
jgi:hypothetical protein